MKAAARFNPEAYQVALDISDHWYIRGGIWRYTVSLAEALVSQLSAPRVRIVCYDRLHPERLAELRTTGATVAASGPHSYLSRLSRYTPPGAPQGVIARVKRRLVPTVPPETYTGLWSTVAHSAVAAADLCHFTCYARFAGGTVP